MPTARAASTFAGSITNSVNWSGQILLTGDVLIAPGGTLTITPGTHVTATALTDSTNRGVDAKRVEIIVNGGKLLAEGTDLSPVTFTSGAAQKQSQDWYGIRVMEGDISLSHFVVEFALNGLQFEDLDTRFNTYMVEDGVIRYCQGYGVYEKAAGANLKPLVLKRLRILSNGLPTNSSGIYSLGPLEIEDSEIRLSGQNGIELVSGPSTFVMRQCLVADNKVRGFLGSSMDSCAILSSTFTRNGYDGIDIDSISELGTFELRDSLIQTNGTVTSSSGAYVHGNWMITCVSNTFQANTDSGLRLALASATSAGPSSEGITANLFTQNKTGMRNASRGSKRWTISNNDFQANTDWELYNDSPVVLEAKENFWSPGTLAELAQNKVNLSRIYDVQDNASSGQVIAASPLANPLRRAPSFLYHPSNATLGVGGSTELISAAIGSLPLTLQWFKDSTSIVTATNASYSIRLATITSAGNYFVVVSNSLGQVTSKLATITIELPSTPVTITIQPAPVTAKAGANASFSVTASGSPPLTYQWRKDGVPIAGQTAATLSLTDLKTSDAGSYSVLVSNAASPSGVTSEAAVLIVQPAVDAVPLHPGDNNPADNRITIKEVTAYAAAWRQNKSWPIEPSPIPVSYLTRAGSLWKSGETYVYNAASTAPLCWVSGSKPAPAPLGRAALTRSSTGNNTATRQLASSYSPQQPLALILTVTPASSVFAYAVEESAPQGWSVANVTQGGTVDATNGKIKWGPFFDSLPRTLTYTATPPADASGVVSFAGVASFDGSDIDIGGPKQSTSTTTGTVDGPGGSTPAGSVIRIAPRTYAAGTKLTIGVQATPNSSTFAYAVEEHPPTGWTVSNITQGGTADATTGSIKWGPFFDNEVRTLEYSLQPPSTAHGIAKFTGVGSFDGVDSVISGILEMNTHATPRLLLSCTTADTDGVSVCFESVPGQMYELQTSTDLVSWTSSGQRVIAAGAATSLRWRHTGSPSTFFRIRTVE